ncbi:hypothetical protein ACC734_36095 [Rhizobium ruizarguesonis]
MSYINPKDVHSPKNHWKLVDVIIDEGPGRCSYAIGTWDDERRIGFRWNGTDENPIGNPQSRGLPTWTMLDEKLHPAVIALAPEDKQSLISSYLNRPRRIELVVDRHPSGRHTLKEREEGKGMYRDLDGHLLANMDEAEFYRAVAREIANRQEAGQHVIYRN